MNKTRVLRRLRIATSVNWLLGAALIASAALGPLLYDNFHVGGYRADVEAVVARIAAGERNQLISRERFLPFSHAQTPPALPGMPAGETDAFTDSRFLIDGMLLKNGHFLIRAVTRPAAMQDHWLPALMYFHEINTRGDTVRKQWTGAS